jgi:hypothetical protein
MSFPGSRFLTGGSPNGGAPTCRAAEGGLEPTLADEGPPDGVAPTATEGESASGIVEKKPE